MRFLMLFSLVVAILCFSVLRAESYSVSINKTQVAQGECLTVTWSGFGDATNIVVYKGDSLWEYANTQGSYEGSQQICTNEWECRSDYKIRVELKSNTTIYVDSQDFEVFGPEPHLVDFLINGGDDTTKDREVYLQFNYTTAEPTHYMAGEKSDFSDASWKTCTSNSVNFTLSSEAEDKVVYFKLKNEYGESNVEQDFISYDPLSYYSISGYITDEIGQGVSGVILTGFPGGSIETNSDGFYKVNDISEDWSGTIEPDKSGYSFSPQSRSYSEISENKSGQDFAATSNASYHWETGEWSECRHTCAGIQKIRTVNCLRSTDDRIVNDSHCESNKPDTRSFDCSRPDSSRLENDLGGNQYISQ